MDKIKSNKFSILLIIVIMIMISSVSYISIILLRNEGSKSTIAPQKTKAGNITYTKLIALNIVDLTPTPTEIVLALASPSPFFSETPTPTDTPQPTLEQEPTAVITISDTAALSPTKILILPETGIWKNFTYLFTFAGLLLFFALIF